MAKAAEKVRAPVKIPKTLGATVDLLYTIQQARKAKQKEADDLETDEKALKTYLIETLPVSDASGVTGKIAHVKIETKKVPTTTDWDAFYKYVLKTKDFSLLQKRLGDAAIKERWDAGKKVPGVDVFNVKTVSVTKRK